MAKPTLLPLLLVLFIHTHISLAHLVSSKFPGCGFEWYHPKCGYECYNSISGAMLNCTVDSSNDMSGMAMSKMTTSATSYATDPSFLKTLAYCMNTTCVGESSVPAWKIEKLWETEVTGDETVIPKLSFTTLSHISHVVCWLWLNLSLLCIANQRLPASIALIIINWMYNDLGGANENYLIRNFFNAMGFLAFQVGATKVACGAASQSMLMVDSGCSLPQLSSSARYPFKTYMTRKVTRHAAGRPPPSFWVICWRDR
jgi:hypothetical protein